MITVASLAKAYGAQSLFREVSLQLNPGCRYGLVGANGSGKSTFLRMLSGDEEPSHGTITFPKRINLGILRQDQFIHDDTPVLDVVMQGHRELWRAIVAKDELLAAEGQFDADRYTELEDVILRHDGYAFEAHCGEILEGLGIPTPQHRQTLGTLSGGFRLRVLLAQVLASSPDCLLLDEPTNHLDIVSIRWLEKFLSSFPGCALVISHDHRFLDNVCTHILDVDYDTISLYHGNYEAFVEAKRTERDRKEAEISKREKLIADRQAFVDRFRAKATKARQAQSKLKQIERIVVEPLPQSSRRFPTFQLSQRRPSGKTVLEIEGLCKSYGSRSVLKNVSLHVRRGDRLAIIGPNGIGKSTLLKILMGSVRADEGRVQWGHETYPGYFAQDHRDILGERAVTVEGWLGEICTGRDIGWVRSQLGKVLFSREEVEKKIANLSGGEAARLIFARLSVEQPNVLILDEPTNHLDLEAIEALVTALTGYDGTLIFVSHDRWFVSRLANRVLEITADGIDDYRGTYQDYLDHCGDDHLDADTALLRARREKRRERDREVPPPTPAEEQRAAKERDALRKQLRLRREVVTVAIDEAERRIEEINAAFCAPGFFERTDEAAVRSMQAETAALRQRLDQLLPEWERLESELAD